MKHLYFLFFFLLPFSYAYRCYPKKHHHFRHRHHCHHPSKTPTIEYEPGLQQGEHCIATAQCCCSFVCSIKTNECQNYKQCNEICKKRVRKSCNKPVPEVAGCACAFVNKERCEAV